MAANNLENNHFHLSNEPSGLLSQNLDASATSNLISEVSVTRPHKSSLNYLGITATRLKTFTQGQSLPQFGVPQELLFGHDIDEGFSRVIRPINSGSLKSQQI